MDLFVPNIYTKSIYTIDYEKLNKAGIKCLIFDIDNTLEPCKVSVPSKKVRDLIEDLKDMNFKVIIMSNSGKNRVAPFKEKLSVDASCLSKKPLKNKYKKIMDIYNYKDTEIAAIGDQLLTDIFGANRMGFTSILTNPISVDVFVGTKINRFIERIIMKKLNKKGLFTIGEYYE